MKLFGVEALRGLAALLVVLSHATGLLVGPKDFAAPPLGGVFTFGFAGVDFFFVLSGFIIQHVHARDIGRPAALGIYGWRRFSRIYPIYWSVMVLYLVLLTVSPSRELYERDPVSVVTSLLLLPHPDHDPILGVAWTLEHEVLFYALFALLIASRRIGRAVLGAWLALILLHWSTGWPGGYPFSFLFSFYNALFFCGIAVAYVLARGPARAPLLAFVAGAALFLAAGLRQSLGAPLPVHSAPLHIAFALGSAAMLYGVAGGELAGRLRRVPGWMVEMGGASYSIYLTHTVALMICIEAIRVLRRHHVPIPLELAFPAIVVAAVIGGVVYSRLVEKPLLRWCRARRVGTMVRS